MRGGASRVLLLLVCVGGALTCGETDTVIVDVSGNVDTLVVQGRVDTTVTTTADTTVGQPDTVVVTRFDTVFSPADTVVITTLDTVFSPADTVFVTTVDTVVSGTDTTIVTTVDTLVTVDTIYVNTVDTVVTIDTVVVTSVDTIVTVDTVIVVDTVRVSSTLVASVDSLNLKLGQAATLTVTARNPLGYQAIPSPITWISDAPGIASVSSSGTVLARAVGRANIYALASGLSATIPTRVADSTSTALPPPPGSRVFLFHSDWSTTTGTTDAALRDMGKLLPWTARKDNGGGTQIVTAASTGLTWPTGLSNVMRIMNLANGSPVQGVRLLNAFAPPTVGQALHYRVYLANTTPDWYTGDNSIHPWQDGPAGGTASNWRFRVESETDGTWRPELFIDGADAVLGTGAQIQTLVLGPASRGQGSIRLQKGVVYGFEIRVQLVSSSRWQPHIRILGANGLVLYDDDDWYRGNGNGETLAGSLTFTINDLTSMAELQLGSNGWAGDPAQDYQALLWGGLAICLNDWCGPYQNGR